MKLLIENWRKYLNEGIDPRIQKQIDSLVSLGGVGVQINPNRRKPKPPIMLNLDTI